MCFFDLVVRTALVALLGASVACSSSQPASTDAGAIAAESASPAASAAPAGEPSSLKADAAGVELTLPPGWKGGAQADRRWETVTARGVEGHVEVHLLRGSTLTDNLAAVMAVRDALELDRVNLHPAEQVVQSASTLRSRASNAAPITETNEFATYATVDHWQDSTRGVVYLHCSFSGPDAKARARALLDTAKIAP